MNNFFTLIFVLFFSTPAFADSTGDVFSTVYNFKLFSTKFREITTQLGQAEKFIVPKGHHEEAICYSIPNNTSYVLFSTSGEFGGSDDKLLGFKVKNHNSENYPCVSPKANLDIPIVGGLKLGISFTEFKDIVGEPLRKTRSDIFVRGIDDKRYLSKPELEKMSQVFPGIYERPYADVSISVFGKFKDDNVIEFGAWRIETY